jgi:hypothetical protein
MELSSLYEGFFEAKGSVKNSKGEAISLAYTFHATTKEEATVVLKKYQSLMATKGLDSPLDNSKQAWSCGI